MPRGWERWTALAGLAYVVLYIAAFGMGIEVGPSDREILDYYADSGHRTKELIAFFLIASAALAFVVFALGLRTLIARVEPPTGALAPMVFGSGVGSATLVLAGNALSRATAFAAGEDVFELDANTRRLFETSGFLLLVSGALAAILLVVAVSLAALRYGVLPRWLGWAGFVFAALLPLAIGFIGFLVLFLWVLIVCGVLAIRGPLSRPSSPE